MHITANEGHQGILAAAMGAAGKLMYIAKLQTDGTRQSKIASMSSMTKGRVTRVCGATSFWIFVIVEAKGDDQFGLDRGVEMFQPSVSAKFVEAFFKGWWLVFTLEDEYEVDVGGNYLRPWWFSGLGVVVGNDSGEAFVLGCKPRIPIRKVGTVSEASSKSMKAPLLRPIIDGQSPKNKIRRRDDKALRAGKTPRKQEKKLDFKQYSFLPTPHSSNNAPVAFNMGQPTSFGPTTGPMLAAPSGFSQPAHHSTAGPLTSGPYVASSLA
ncbi:hypothetical protein Tco_0646434 [Tanacetum coccineum]